MTLDGSPLLAFHVLTGMVDLDDARARGAELEGDVDALRRVLERAADRAHSASSASV